MGSQFDSDEWTFKVTEGNTKKYKNGWAKWRTPAVWEKEMIAQPNYRFILPNELLMETDFDECRTNKEMMDCIQKLLDEKGICYEVWFSGNKSYHCHVLFDDLEKVSLLIRPKVKKALAERLTNEEIAKSLDFSNFGNERMIQIKGMPHRKNRQLKTCVAVVEGTNKLPEGLIEQVEKKGHEKSLPKNYNIPTPNKCAFAEYILTHKIDAENKYIQLCPNVSAYTRNLANKEDIRKQYNDLQNPEDDIDRLGRWDNRPSKFNCFQMRLFAKKIGKNNLCEKCLVEEFL